MLISRISGRKVTAFFLNNKVLIFIFLIYLLISRNHFSNSPVHWRL